MGEGLTVDGHVFWREHFVAEGEVHMASAHIGGSGIKWRLSESTMADGDEMRTKITIDGGMFCPIIRREWRGRAGGGADQSGP